MSQQLASPPRQLPAGLVLAGSLFIVFHFLAIGALFLAAANGPWPVRMGDRIEESTASGPKFAATVSETGFQMLGFGTVVLIALVLPIVVIGLFVYRMPYDEMAGIVAGACGNPAILAYSNRLAPTDRPDLGYAMIFPGMTIIKILFVDIVAKLF